MAFGQKGGEKFELTRRLTPILLIFIFGLGVVGTKILYLQIGMGQALRKKSQKNRIRHDILPARRGIIVDRNGKVLAADEPIFNLRRRGSLRSISEETVRELSRGLGVKPPRMLRRVFEDDSRTVVSGLSDQQKIWFAEHSGDFKSFEIQVRPRRVYRFGRIAAPVLGYTGEISPSELDRRRAEGLSQGKYVGKTGIEQYYDSILQGQDGIRWVETTATGEILRELDSPEAIEQAPGDSLTLNLDIRLQTAVAKTFPSDSAGAAVVMEIPSGKIRALYSHPSYDPNSIVSGERRAVKDLLDAPGDPLHNRVIQSRFPPGSTFKLIPFLAALISPDYPVSQDYYCRGELRLGDHTFRCWKEEGHGRIALNGGLVHSCNVYFYNLVQELGYSPIKTLAQSMNYSRRTNIDLPEEVASQLSTPELKNTLTENPWVTGDELNAVIGQGYTLVSPVKQAQLLGSILTDQYIRPGLREGAEGRLSESFPPSDPAVEHLVEVMGQITDEGTGYWAQHDENYRRIGVDVIGKTGTVQKVKKDDMEDTPPSDAWFVSAAPQEDPSYVVVVFRSEAGTGGDVAAPHAREIYKHMIKLGYFRNRFE